MKSFSKMAYPYLIWAIIMILIPLAMIFVYAFTTGGNSVRTFIFTLDNFAKFFSDKVFIEVLVRSLYIAIMTTIFCILLGYPTAYVIAKYFGKGQGKLILAITLPTWINMLVRTYAWRGILQKDGLINAILGLVGIGPLQMLETNFAVILGMVYNFLPFMVLQIYSSLSKMDESYIQAASDLGANKVQTFLKVTLPLSIPGIISGVTLVFLPAVSSFFIPKLLGGGKFVLIGNIIENQFLTAGNWGFGSAISLIMAIIIMISMYFARRVDKKVSPEGSDD